MIKMTPFYVVLLMTLIPSIMCLAAANSAPENTDPAEYPREGARTSEFYDGPYLIHQGDSTKILTGIPQNGEMKLHIQTLPRHQITEVKVYKSGFLPRIFTVPLKKEIVTPPAVYPAADRIFVLSDVEGNFNTVVNLLQQHGVIDDQLNWIFAAGHLVMIGDVFDRGNHVTELLWLLYRLEDQANIAGGAVHFILGNHDMMNLRGDLRYLEKKYHTFAKLTEAQEKLTFPALFSPASELGRWVRAKNTVEKIGDLIFVHGGISPIFAAKNYSLEEINTIARHLIDVPKSELSDEQALCWGRSGPFWYRGYFEMDEMDWGPRATQPEVEAILQQYEAQRIFVGHTQVEKPELRYNGRVCAVDVRHPADHLLYAPPLHSYGVLIENGAVFVVDDDGNSTKLD